MSHSFTKEQYKIINDALKERASLIEKELSALPLFKELMDIRAILNENESSSLVTTFQSKLNLDITPSHDDGYNPKLSGIKKAEFILRENKKGMTTSEIADVILLREPKLKRSLVVSNLSAVLGLNAKAKKTLYREANELGEWTYYLIKWLETKESPEFNQAIS